MDTLAPIVINGLLVNKTIVCHLLESKTSFKTLLVLMENY